VNDHRAESNPRSGHPTASLYRGRSWILAAVLLVAVAPALATATFSTAANGQYEYDSNVWDMQPGFSAFGVPEAQGSDHFYSYYGLMKASDQWSEQKISASLSGSDYKYDRFTELNHTEYALDAAWNWVLGQLFTGNLEFSQTQTMVQLYDIVQIQLPLARETRYTAGIDLLINPDWRIETTGYHRTVAESLLGEPNLRLTETFGQASLIFGSLTGLNGGLSAGYKTGSFEGGIVAANPSYREYDYNLVASYQKADTNAGPVAVAKGVSTFTGQVGYTDRNSATGINKYSGFTGQIDYKNQLTFKTSVDLALRRQTDTFIINDGSDLTSMATLSVNWQATFKTGFIASYSLGTVDYPGQGNEPIGSERFDHVQYAILNIDYEAQTWLALRPYARLQTRRSNFDGGNYDASIIGITFSVHWQS
jgi:hypothetical protein